MRARAFVTLGVLLVGGGCNALTGAADVSFLAPDDQTDDTDASIETPAPKVDGGSTVDASDAGPSDADVAGDADAEAGPRGPLRAFLSSTTFQGNLGGLAGADTSCANLAAAQGLGGTGKWVAILSTFGDDVRAIDRVTSDGPWQMVNGQVVANSKADLFDGDLLNPLRRTEKGDVIGTLDDRVWTGTRPDGTPGQLDCQKWTTNNANSGGLAGEAEFKGNAWTAQLNESCANANRLYCFEL